MARLDPFIQILHEQRGDTLHLAPGKAVSLTTNGGTRALSKTALTDVHVVAFIREMAPASVASLVGADAPMAFAYAAPSGGVDVELTPGPDGPSAVLRRTGGATTSTVAGREAQAAQVTQAAVSAANDAQRQGAQAEIETLLRALADGHASDLHLRAGEPPVYRRHGELARNEGPAYTPDRLQELILSIMSPRNRDEYLETGDCDWAHEISDVARFRCNAGRDRLGPIAVMRVIPAKVPTAEQLGLSKEVQALCQLTKGLVVVTGPTGSGKSTTLAAMVDLVNRTRGDHILTIEDPIEFVHQGKKCVVTQRQVGLHTRGFKTALRAALREDPDVILVGEMRDLETVSIAIETAETGHLVFGTLHTTTAASTVDRIIDQFPADRQSQVRVMLAESLRGVIAQTLLKKVGGGRVAAREILLSIPAITNLIREGKTFQIPSIMQTNRKVGMVTLNDALLELVDAKLVEPQEAYFKSVEKTGFLTQLKTRKHDTSWHHDSA